jgi:hypothetical protein
MEQLGFNIYTFEPADEDVGVFRPDAEQLTGYFRSESLYRKERSVLTIPMRKSRSSTLFLPIQDYVVYENIEDTPLLISDTVDEGIDLQKITPKDILDKVDLRDPVKVAEAMSTMKLITESKKAEKITLELARTSNSLLPVVEVKKTMVGAITGLKATMNTSVPKVSAEIVSSILNQIAREDPTLVAKVDKMIDRLEVTGIIRATFDKSLTELSDVLTSLSEAEVAD